MTVRAAIVALVGLSIGVWSGCGADNPLNRQPVSGTVTFNGEPVARGSIRFDSVTKGPTLAGGKIRKGSYTIAGEKGLAPGEYAVYINIQDPNWDARKEPSPREMAPPEYTNGQHRVTVTEGSNEFDFDIRTQ
jgi:type 1 fimbria pilin